MSREQVGKTDTTETRFEFGKNWRRFLAKVDGDRIRASEKALLSMLRADDLKGKTFLDIGCGSGLSSLAARRLGARVHSFDYDPESVACTMELRRRYFPEDREWTVEQGSALDRDYLSRLGQFDIVYSWGVLHHTGDMWSALENAIPLAGPGAFLFIAIYNDQGTASKRWRWVKKLYNELPRGLRFIVIVPSFLFLNWRPMLKDLILLRPFRSWREQGKGRGMSPWHDLIDWVGGYPFEVASPEAIFNFYRDRGFTLVSLKTTRSLGCNQFVFVRRPTPGESVRRSDVTGGAGSN